MLPIIVVVWLGIWAAQHRILEHPERHLPLLRVTAVVGLGSAFLGGLPYALVGAGWLHVDAATVDRLAYLHGISGEYGGPGYAAAFALVAVRLSRRTNQGPGRHLGRGAGPPVAVRLPHPVGRVDGAADAVDPAPRCPRVHHPRRAGVGVLAWVGTAAAAGALERRGHAGPAETVLRKLVYRP